MDSDKRGPVRFDFAFDQSNELFVAGRAAKPDNAKITKFSGGFVFLFFFPSEFGCCSVRLKILFHFSPKLCAFKPMLRRCCKDRDQMKKAHPRRSRCRAPESRLPSVLPTVAPL